MIIDSHMHVWSMDDVDYYDDKTIYQYMQENAIDKTAIIAISEKENAEMKKVVQNEPDKFFGLGYTNSTVSCTTNCTAWASRSVRTNIMKFINLTSNESS